MLSDDLRSRHIDVNGVEWFWAGACPDCRGRVAIASVGWGRWENSSILAAPRGDSITLSTRRGKLRVIQKYD